MSIPLSESESLKAVTTHTQHIQRISWVDVGKALAIIIIFFYHGIERLINQGFPCGTIEGRFLASFTIPFFFFLSGYVYRERKVGFKDFLLQRFNRLIVPLFFFNLLSLLILLAIRAWGIYLPVMELPGSISMKLAGLFLLGLPAFNGPTWFLTCLFSVQVLCFLVVRCTQSNHGLLTSIVGFSVLGFLIVPFLDHQYFFLKAVKYAWYIPTALTAIVFFQIGILSRRISFVRFFNSSGKVWMGLCLSMGIVVLTFNLNTSAYTGYWKMTYINHLNMGNYVFFYVTALSGILGMICLTLLIRLGKVMQFYGNNTLVLLGIDGFFYHYVNPSIGDYCLNHGQTIPWFFFLVVFIGIAIIQLAACYPLIRPIDKILKYITQSVSAVVFRLRKMNSCLASIK